MRWILVSIFLMSSFAAFATEVAKTNGCGTGWNRYLVPDSLPLNTCQFKVSCDKHDVCYGRCGDLPEKDRPARCEYLRCRPGGDLYKKQDCDDVKYVNLRADAEARREKCDANFYTDIISTNSKKPVCRAFAAIYRSAVQYLGQGAFVGIDGKLTSGLSKSQEGRSNAAIAALLTNLTDAQLLTYSESLEKGQVKIDWSKEISFSSDKLLYNPQQVPR